MIDLPNGQKIPAIGFGTWEIKPHDTVEAVTAALRAGYRLIDTAKLYGNEKQVGEAVMQSGLPREEVFVTTKLWNDDQGYESTRKALEQSLERLGFDYVDLYLIHWPATSRRLDSWRAMNEMYDEGLIGAIGVSNFTIRHLEEIRQAKLRPPMVNQVEFHPYIYTDQQKLLNYCYDHNIVVEAYSPLARGGIDHPEVDAIAEEIGRSQAQVLLRWSIQHGTIPLPRSTSAQHIKDNIEVFDFELSAEMMNRLNKLSVGRRVTWDPAKMS